MGEDENDEPDKSNGGEDPGAEEELDVLVRVVEEERDEAGADGEESEDDGADDGPGFPGGDSGDDCEEGEEHEGAAAGDVAVGKLFCSQ